LDSAARDDGLDSEGSDGGEMRTGTGDEGAVDFVDHVEVECFEGMEGFKAGGADEETQFKLGEA
jgi:hypothetical protein